MGSFSSLERFHKLFILPAFINRRVFILVILLVLSNILQSVVILKLIDSSRENRFIIVGDANGHLKTLDIEPFLPTAANVSYFIRLWVERLLSVDIRSIRRDLSLASSWVRGPAVTELYRFVQSDMPGKNISDNKGYGRSVSFHSLVIGGNHDARYADLTLTLTIYHNGAVTSREDKMMHIEFFILPPVHENDAKYNPLGLFVTHFSISPMNASGIASSLGHSS
ncbi:MULTISPECIES: type IV secretion system protein [Candidatus Ichthyocystis]|uniref:type IV secretion system protein n=1 Tax=Candidatus Ichthyocystis TaxID=2929841 RepID=UPI000B83EBC0|nr:MULTISPECIES: type IV secretion system protein [Ichthyocystis]